MQEPCLLLQHRAIYGCSELIETALEMFVSLRVPAEKRRHIGTGELKEINKGIIYTGLSRDGSWSQPRAPGWESQGEGLVTGRQREQL